MRSGPVHDAHYVRTRLVCLENTHNRGGGRVHSLESIGQIARWAREHNLAMHLDGARLMNAVVATGHPAREWAQHFDTVSICFSKGLGAPVGSALAGSADAIRRARRLRKLFGGGMRQAGILAAAALYALEHHVDRLSEDHANARVLADAFAGTEGFALESGPVETNLVWVDGRPLGGDRRRGGRVPSLAQHPGHRDRAAGASRLHASRRVARRDRICRRSHPRDRAGHDLGDDAGVLERPMRSSPRNASEVDLATAGARHGALGDRCGRRSSYS